MKPGQRVWYNYWHVICRNGHWATKRGVFVRMMRDRVRCLVHVDGNKNPSKVPFKDIRRDV